MNESRRHALAGSGPTSCTWPAPHESGEPVSPELVLVDPQLGRDGGVRRAHVAGSSPPPRSERRGGDDTAVPASNSMVASVAQAALAATLLITATVAFTPLAGDSRSSPTSTPTTTGDVVSARGVRPWSRASRSELRPHGAHQAGELAAAPAPPKALVGPRPRGAASNGETTVVEAQGPTSLPRLTRADAERRVLAVLVQSPSGKLPPELVDAETGLAEDNLQAVCRLERPPASFACFVRPAHGRDVGLSVRYAENRGGKPRFSFGPYRDG